MRSNRKAQLAKGRFALRGKLSLFLLDIAADRLKPQGPSEVEIQPAGSAKAQTLSQPSKLLQLWKGNIRKVSTKENRAR